MTYAVRTPPAVGRLVPVTTPGRGAHRRPGLTVSGHVATELACSWENRMCFLPPHTKVVSTIPPGCTFFSNSCVYVALRLGELSLGGAHALQEPILSACC